VRPGALVASAIALALGAGCALPPTPAPTPAAVPCRQARCLRVLTWNVHGIPFVAPHTTRRLRNVAAKIREQQPDVALLQEVWAHAYARVLERALAGQYRLVRATGCRRPYPCGGLIVLVRVASGWAASPPTFVPFEAAGRWHRLREFDGIAKKGMLLIRLARGEQTIGLVDTHLQSRYAEYGHGYVGVRRGQLEQLRATVAAAFAAEPVILAGDFNVAPQEASGLYISYVANLGDDRTTAFRAGCPECGTRSVPKRPRWIDYVITRALVADATLARFTNDGPDDPFSDHEGLLVRLECERAAPCGL
jgi:endonuclease/exonuclease/phosphatase family metal-dependent hydrolase